MNIDIKAMERILGAEIPPEARRDLEKAWEFYRKFWRRSPSRALAVDLNPPGALAEMGDLVAVVYVRGKGTPKAYIHVFKPPFPILAEGNGRLWIVGGGYEVDSKGIIK